MEWDRPGGLNRYVRALVRALAAEGCAPRTLVLGPVAGATPDAVVPVAAHGDSLPVRLLGYRRAARRQTASVLDVHFALYGLGPLTVTAMRRSPLVVHFHGPWADESADAGRRSRAAARARHLVERYVYRRADAVVVLSHAFADVVVSRYGVRPDRVQVIRPGIDLDRFSPARHAARTALGLDDGTQVLFTARRLYRRMGLDVLIDALEELPSCTVVVAGSGPERGALTDQIRARQVEDRVVLLGGVDDERLVAWYRAADAVVVPSRAFEGFGLVVLEALACGVPVVVTDVGGLPEAVDGLDAELVVPAEDPGALARAVRHVLEGGGPTAAECRRHAERFSWGGAAREHVALYRSLMEEAAA